jgi:hypothetical protein
MDKRDNEIAQAVMAIKESGAGDNAVEAVRSLVSMIPFAGGPLSNVLGEYRTRESAKRIAETFEMIHRRVIDSDVDPSEVVSEQEVIELVDGALREVVTTADDRKLAYLRNSLGSALTDSEIAYTDKQAYLMTLRSLTKAELDILLYVYGNSDPFVIQEVPPKERDLSTNLFPDGTPHIGASAYSDPTVYMDDLRKVEKVEGYSDPSEGETLEEKLMDRIIGTLPATTRSAVASLDGKGLTTLASNLGRRTVKRISMVDPQSLMMINSGANSQMLSISQSQVVQSTPMEASKTDYGHSFLEFVSRS